jgi:hypothetical protein
MHYYMKFAHIVFAGVAATLPWVYVLLLVQARKNPGHATGLLRFFMRLDTLLGMPSLLLAAITGLGMAHYYAWANWIIVSLVIWAVAMGAGHGMMRAGVRRTLKAISAPTPDIAKAQAQAGKIQVGSLLLASLMLVLLVLMYFKPF